MSRKISPTLTAPNELRDLGQLTADDFAPLLNTPFSLPLDGGQILEVTLTDVRAGAAYPGSGRTPFSLLFQGTPGLVLPQQIYPLTHPSLGTLEIFIVPIGASPAETTYEAVFN